VPPEVTAGVEELAVGACEEVPLLPVVPEVPVEKLPPFVAESPPELDDEVDPVVVLVESDVPVVRGVLPAPGWS
jgi:hypothetical protein